MAEKMLKFVKTIFLMVIVIQLNLSAKTNDIRFDHITVEDGLLGNIVFCIFQDSREFIWFGTINGLNCYDGYKMKVFKKEIDNPNSLPSNSVKAIYEDRNGLIWIGTKWGGLSSFDPKKEIFTNYERKPDDPFSLPGSGVNKIYEDQSGNLWLTIYDEDDVLTTNHLVKFNQNTGIFEKVYIKSNETDTYMFYSFFPDQSGFLWLPVISGGIIKFNPITETYLHYKQEPENPNSLSDNNIVSFFEDDEGIIWIATAKGNLNRFDYKSGKFDHYRYLPENTELNINITLESLPSICEDDFGNLWFTVEGKGLFIFNKISKGISQYKNDPLYVSSLISNRLRSILKDKSGVIWIGSTGGGINKFNPLQYRFDFYSYNPQDSNTPSNNNIWAVSEDKNGNIWIGHDNGVDKLDPYTNKFTHHVNNPDNEKSISVGENISAIFEDSQGILWIGSYGGGLNRFDRNTGYFYHYRYIPGDEKSICSDLINEICEDQYGNLLISTRNGICILDKNRERFYSWNEFYKNSTDTISSIPTKMIYLDTNNEHIWIATSADGLIRYSRKDGQIKHFKHLKQDNTSLSENRVKVIHKDNNGALWIGTLNGLNKYIRENDTFLHYTEKDGLPSDVIAGILEDRNGNLWISTNNGISKFDPVKEIFKNYGLADGLPGFGFGRGSMLKSQNGSMYFGCNNGLVTFHADRIQDNPHIPRVYLTDFKLFNKQVPIGGNSPLKNHIDVTKELTLTHEQSIFSLEFAALGYHIPDKNLYKYKLEGLETDWNQVDSKQRIATYTNLDPGNYTFHVIGSNNDGIWNEEGTSVKITILPPFWQSWWFKSIGILFILSFIIILYKARTYNIKKRNIQLKKLVRERTSDLRNVNKELESFSYSVSHDLRAPLRAIDGYARILIEDHASKLNKEGKRLGSVIQDNAKKMGKLIDDLLNFSRLERTSMTYSKIDMKNMVNAIYYETTTKKDRQRVKFTVSDLPGAIGDPTMMNQVWMNLISNALKYSTHCEQAVISISYQEKENNIIYCIKDNGVGFNIKYKDKLFVVFQRLHSEKKFEGTGVGLALVQRIIIRHGGRVWAEGEVDKGATFYFSLPKNRRA